MSAIVITHALPSERTRLLSESDGYENGVDRDDGLSGRYGTERREDQQGHNRVEPLKYSISKLRFIIVLAGIWSSNFVFAFQSTAIPTLAPSISSEFNHAELAAYLGSVFTLANTAGIPVYGVFMDILGRKFAMCTACTFFGVGTAMCALAPSMYWLIAARGFAGLGGGGLLTVSAVICTDLVPLRDRGHYQGIMMTIFGAGVMIGGPLAGYLADHHGWPWAFWIQIPIIILCIIVVLIFLPEPSIPPTHQTLISGLASLDWIGTVLLLGSVSSLILGLSFHTSYLRPWGDPLVYGLLVLAVFGGFLFVVVEGKVERPLIPLSLFRDSQLLAIYGASFFLAVVSSAFNFQIPFYFAVVLNASTAVGGAIISVSGGLGNCIGSVAAGYHIRHGGSYKLLGTISLIPASLAAFAASFWNPSWPWWGYYATCFPPVLGYSVFLCVSLVALISSVDSKTMPKATALLYTVRSLGGTLGLSTGASIQIGSLATNLQNQLESLGEIDEIDEIIQAVLHSKSAIRGLPENLQIVAIKAYGESLATVWWVLGFTACLTILASLGIRENFIPEKKKIKRRVGARGGGTGGGVVEAAFGEGLGEGVGAG